jgi:hypothetical protein
MFDPKPQDDEPFELDDDFPIDEDDEEGTPTEEELLEEYGF